MKTLTWKVSYTRPTACPDYKPDPYTGQFPSTHCLVYHCETVTEDKSKEFLTEEEALSFAEKAPPSCHSFKLNGELIEDKRPQTSTTFTDISGSTTTASGTNSITFN